MKKIDLIFAFLFILSCNNIINQKNIGELIKKNKAFNQWNKEIKRKNKRLENKKSSINIMDKDFYNQLEKDIEENNDLLNCVLAKKIELTSELSKFKKHHINKELFNYASNYFEFINEKSEEYKSRSKNFKQAYNCYDERDFIKELRNKLINKDKVNKLSIKYNSLMKEIKSQIKIFKNEKDNNQIIEYKLKYNKYLKYKLKCIFYYFNKKFEVSTKYSNYRIKNFINGNDFNTRKEKENQIIKKLEYLLNSIKSDLNSKQNEEYFEAMLKTEENKVYEKLLKSFDKNINSLLNEISQRSESLNCKKEIYDKEQKYINTQNKKINKIYEPKNNSINNKRILIRLDDLKKEIKKFVYDEKNIDYLITKTDFKFSDEDLNNEEYLEDLYKKFTYSLDFFAQEINIVFDQKKKYVSGTKLIEDFEIDINEYTTKKHIETELIDKFLLPYHNENKDKYLYIDYDYEDLKERIENIIHSYFVKKRKEIQNKENKSDYSNNFSTDLNQNILVNLYCSNNNIHDSEIQNLIKKFISSKIYNYEFTDNQLKYKTYIYQLIEVLNILNEKNIIKNTENKKIINFFLDKVESYYNKFINQKLKKYNSVPDGQIVKACILMGIMDLKKYKNRKLNKNINIDYKYEEEIKNLEFKNFNIRLSGLMGGSISDSSQDMFNIMFNINDGNDLICFSFFNHDDLFINFNSIKDIKINFKEVK